MVDTYMPTDKSLRLISVLLSSEHHLITLHLLVRLGKPKKKALSFRRVGGLCEQKRMETAVRTIGS